MGRAKALWMEMEDTQWEETGISFYCPECEADADGTVELPIVYDNGDRTELPVTVECGICESSFEGWVESDWDCCEIKLDDHPTLKIMAEPARGSENAYENYDQEYYEWLEQQEPLSRPVYQAFYKTIGDVQSLALLPLLEQQQAQMLTRMLLAQSITALEVFLADTLITIVAKNKRTQERLLKTSELGIGGTRFKLTDAIGVEDFSKMKLLEHLRAVSFHNLKKVEKLFKVGLDIDILPKGEDLELVQKAILMRHDCVHRNGLDKSTGEVHQIDKALIHNLAQTLLKMAKSVDEQVEDLESPF